jgi:hypothetical protein
MSNPVMRFVRHPDFIFRRVADELILVPIRQRVGDLQSLYTLTPVAARIWELLDGTRNTGAIAQQLVDEFDVTAEQAEADATEFLHEMEKIGAAVTAAEQER